MAMRTDTQTTLRHPRIRTAAGRLTLTAEVAVELPLPAHDGDLPGRAEAVRDAAGHLARLAGEDDLIAPTTVLAVLHAEGERLRAANRERAEAVLREAPTAPPAPPARPLAPPTGFPGAQPIPPAGPD